MLCGLLRLIPLVLLLRRQSLMLLLVPLPLIRRATFTLPLAASAAIAASISPAPTALAAASDFETSDQGMAAVGPVRAPVELFHADEATLQIAQTEICSQIKNLFRGSIRRGETIQDSTASLLFCYLNIVILYIET